MALLRHLFIVSFLGLWELVDAFNNPPGVDVWCGKAYRPTNSSFDPGGALHAPPPNTSPDTSRLSLHIYPRYSIYLTSEPSASLIVDTPITQYGDFGSPFVNQTFDTSNSSTPSPLTHLKLSVYLNGNGSRALIHDVSVPVNQSGFEVPFNLSSLVAPSPTNSSKPLSLHAIATSPDAIQSFQTTTSIQVLTPRTDGGSTSRIDRLTRALYTTSSITNGTWAPVFPFSFYTRWDWISYLVDPANNPFPPNLASNQTTSLEQYRERGYNVIHAVPPGGYTSFDDATLDKFLTECDRIGLYVLYDMRHTYLNLSSISTQLPRLQHHPSLLIYYTGDEPDGATDPLNGTRLAYDRLRAIDPYHPVSLVLNCENFYFDEYTSGADVILEDTYSLINSSSFSAVYDTPCNTTYGDCGCDNCIAFPEPPSLMASSLPSSYPTSPANSSAPKFDAAWLADIAHRIDIFQTYQTWLDAPFQKPIWGVPQWFFDGDSFWRRWATGHEAVLMALVRLNHGAMGIMAWLYPTSTWIEDETTTLGRVLGREDVTAGLVGGKRVKVGEGHIDGAVWWGEGGDGIVSLVFLGSESLSGGVVDVGEKVESVEVLYGESWEVDGEGKITRQGLEPGEVSLLKIGT